MLGKKVWCIHSTEETCTIIPFSDLLHLIYLPYICLCFSSRSWTWGSLMLGMRRWSWRFIRFPGWRFRSCGAGIYRKLRSCRPPSGLGRPWRRRLRSCRRSSSGLGRPWRRWRWWWWRRWRRRRRWWWWWRRSWDIRASATGFVDELISESMTFPQVWWYCLCFWASFTLRCRPFTC